VDQTALYFDMPTNTTTAAKGEKSVIFCTTSSEKQQCTAMLALTAGGILLPPCVIFKRKTMPEGKFLSSRVSAREGCVDAAPVCIWIHTFWDR
jgi:hypothetical protein